MPKLVALPNDYRPSATKKRKLKEKESKGSNAPVSDENASVLDESTLVSDESEKTPVSDGSRSCSASETDVQPPRVSSKAPTISRKSSISLVRANSFRPRLPLSPIKSNSNKTSPTKVSPTKQNLKVSVAAAAVASRDDDFIDISSAPKTSKSVQKRLFSALEEHDDTSLRDSSSPVEKKRARLAVREKRTTDDVSAFSRGGVDFPRPLEVCWVFLSVFCCVEYL